MTSPDSAITTLASRLRGSLLRPGDEGYDGARTVWNARFNRSPAAIVRCAGIEDVVAAIQFGRQAGMEISVKGGGHDYAGNTVAEGSLLIDLGPMDSVEVDVAGRRALVGAGATWGQVDGATQEHGLATPGATVSTVGVAGFTLGGGEGWLLRKHGLAADNLLGARLVTAEGTIVRADEARARELGPGLALGHQWSAWLDLLTGRPAEALEAAVRATRLDPLDPEARGNLALALVATGDPERAAREARRVLEIHPDFDYSLWVLGIALHHTGDPSAGQAKWVKMQSRQFTPWALLGRALDAREAGDDVGLREGLQGLEGVEAPFKTGVLRAALDEPDAAFAAFRRAQPLFWDDALFLRYFRAPPMRALRGSSAYEELIRELDTSWGEAGRGPTSSKP